MAYWRLAAGQYHSAERHPFGQSLLYTLPVTGESPVKFGADGLPPGLEVNSETGRITGTVSEEKVITVLLRAENRHGNAEKELTIAVGPGTDAYDRTVTMLSGMTDLTHNRTYSRSWVPWEKFPCRLPWEVTQYPARP